MTGEDVRALAPAAFGALDAVAANVDGAADPRFVALARSHIGGLLGLGAPEQPVAGLSAAEQACVEMAEQFVLDVGSTTTAQRVALNDALGPAAFAYVQVLYAVDYGIRVHAAIRQLFDVDVNHEAGKDDSLWSALEEWMRQVARMDALDPLTTELVRLRGARTHDCRLCKSRRHIVAVEGGADETVFARIDHYETSTLDERHKVALRMTDAIIWQPTAHPPELRDQVRSNLSPREGLELVFDVARNATNKIAVALGADEPHVTEGVEYFDTDQDGALILGMTPGR
jgi:alkylhydroperoxidase family enzyme